MFAISQIKAAHAQVKSGADFPAYIQALKEIGVLRYEHFVSDGHIVYAGQDAFTISADAKWPLMVIAAVSNTANLHQALAVHQAGGTDYPTFCQEAAQAGVEKWTVNIARMTCTYYDTMGNEVLVEAIPAP